LKEYFSGLRYSNYSNAKDEMMSEDDGRDAKEVKEGQAKTN